MGSTAGVCVHVEDTHVIRNPVTVSVPQEPREWIANNVGIIAVFKDSYMIYACGFDRNGK